MVKNKIFYPSLFILLLAADQLAKFFARKLTASIPVIKNFLSLSFVKNTGIGFGLLQNANAYIIWVSIIALGFIIYYHDKIPKNTFPRLMVLFISVGIVGNLIDRIFFGFVIDFIDFSFWPVFNIADTLITVGIIGLIAWSLKR